MAEKKITANLKMKIPAGKASAGPPVGSTLGQYGVNMMDFIQPFNDATKDMRGDIVPVEISVYEDRTFTFAIKTPPASALILKAIGKEKGSGKNAVSKVGTLSKAQLREIAERKMQDLNANDIDAAMKIIAGSARSMGVDVK